MISGKKLAELLDVTPSALTRAVQNRHMCGGYDVARWAVKNGGGRVEGYDVPESVLRELGVPPQNPQQRIWEAVKRLQREAEPAQLGSLLIAMGKASRRGTPDEEIASKMEKMADIFEGRNGVTL